jgi:glycosyltransferase involved in cell wall biosynthesis
MGFIFCYGIITAVYAGFILKIITGFNQLPVFKSKKSTPTTGFSILIPIRNEAKNLPKLLDSIAQLNYPAELFELILIDDFSEDNSQQIYLNWRLKNSQFEKMRLCVLFRFLNILGLLQPMVIVWFQKIGCNRIMILFKKIKKK